MGLKDRDYMRERRDNNPKKDFFLKPKAYKETPTKGRIPIISSKAFYIIAIGGTIILLLISEGLKFIK